jgi:hypothetical protein
MKLILTLAAALLAPTLLVAGPACAQAARPEALIRAWQQANSDCRGYPGDDPRSVTGCAERSALGRRIDRAGWCYGQRGQRGFELQWHRCGPSSIRAE